MPSQTPTLITTNNRNSSFKPDELSTSCLACSLKNAVSSLQTTCHMWLCDSCVNVNNATNARVSSSKVARGDFLKNVDETSCIDSARSDENKARNIKSEDNKFVDDSVVTCRKEIVQKNVDKLKAKLIYVQNMVNRITTTEQDVKKRKGDICIVVLENNLKVFSDFIHQCTRLLNIIHEECDTKLEDLVNKRKEINTFVDNVKQCVKKVDQTLSSMSDVSIQFIQNADICEINRLLETEIAIDRSLFEFSIGYEFKESGSVENGELDIGVLTINNKSFYNRLKTNQRVTTHGQHTGTSEEARCYNSTCSACNLDQQISVSPDMEKNNNNRPQKRTDSFGEISLMVTESENLSLKHTTDDTLPTLVKEKDERPLLEDESKRNESQLARLFDNATPPVLTKDPVSMSDESSSFYQMDKVYSVSDVSNAQGSVQNLRVKKYGDVVRYKRQSGGSMKHSPNNDCMMKCGTDKAQAEAKSGYVKKDTDRREENMQTTERPNEFLNPYVNLCPKAVHEYERKGVILSDKHCLHRSAVVTGKAKDTMKLTESYFVSLSARKRSDEQSKERPTEGFNGLKSDHEPVKDLTSESDNNHLGAKEIIKNTSVQTSPIQSETLNPSMEYKYVLLDTQSTVSERPNNCTNPVCYNEKYSGRGQQQDGVRLETNIALMRENTNTVTCQVEQQDPNESVKVTGKNYAVVNNYLHCQTESQAKTTEEYALKNNDLRKKITEMVASVCKSIDNDRKVDKSSSTGSSSTSEGHAVLLDRLDKPVTNILYSCLTRPAEKQQDESKKPRSTSIIKSSLDNTMRTTSASSTVYGKNKSSAGESFSSNKSKSAITVSPSLYNPAKKRQKSGLAGTGSSRENGDPKPKRRRTKSAVQTPYQRNHPQNESSERHADLWPQHLSINNPRFCYITFNQQRQQMLANNSAMFPGVPRFAFPVNNNFFGHSAMPENVNPDISRGNEMCQTMERQREHVNFVGEVEINVDHELSPHFNTYSHSEIANSGSASEIREGISNDTNKKINTNMNMSNDMNCRDKSEIGGSNTFQKNNEPVIPGKNPSTAASEFGNDREAIQSLYSSELHVKTSIKPSAESQENLINSRALGSYLEVSENTQTVMNDPSMLVSPVNQSSRPVPALLRQTGASAVQQYSHSDSPSQSHVPPTVDRVDTSLHQYSAEKAVPRQHVDVRNTATSRHPPIPPYKDIPCHPAVSSVDYRSHLKNLGRSVPLPSYPGVPRQGYIPSLSNRSHAQYYNDVQRDFNVVDADVFRQTDFPPNGDGRRHTDDPHSRQHDTTLNSAVPQYQNNPNNSKMTHLQTHGDTQGREDVSPNRLAPANLNSPSSNDKQDRQCVAPNRVVPGYQNVPRNQSTREGHEIPPKHLSCNMDVPSYRNIRHRPDVLSNQNVFRQPPYNYIPRHQDMPPNRPRTLHENAPPNGNMPGLLSRNASRSQYPASLSEVTRQENPDRGLDTSCAAFVMNQRISQTSTRSLPTDCLISPEQRQVPSLTQYRRPGVDKVPSSYTSGQFNEAYAAIQTSFIQNQSRPRHARQIENVFTEITNRLWNIESPISNDAVLSKGKT